MKKVLSIMLTFAMLLAFVPVGFAGADDAVAVVVDTVIAAPADTGVEVYVRMTAEPHWAALELEITFDPDVLVYKGFRRNPALDAQAAAGETMMYTVNVDSVGAGSVGVYYTTAGSSGGYFGYNPNGCDYFGILTFDVAATAPVGLSDISAAITSLTSFEGENVPFTIANGGVNVVACEHDWQITAHEDEDCENAGFTDYECSICHSTKHVDIPARGHHWNELERVEPTTDTEGHVTYECVWCGLTRTEILSVLPPFDGIRVRVEKVAATPGAKNIDLKIYVEDVPHWSSLSFNIFFDKDVLTYKKFTLNPVVAEQRDNGESIIYALNLEKAAMGEVYILLASAYITDGYEGYHSGGYDYLGTLRVNVADSAVPGFTPVDVQVTMLTDNLSQQIPHEVVGGGVQINCVHDWQEIERAEYCEDDGYVVYECSKCQELKRENVDPIGHDWGDWAVTAPATCSAEGVETRVCSHDASHVETRAVAIDPDAHEWVESGRTAPTCSVEGAVYYFCAHNPDHEKAEPIAIDPDAHEWGEWEVTTPATCTEEGVETRVCSHNASHIETRAVAIDADAHAWGEWEVTTPATCSAEGVETRVCEYDKEHVETRAIAIDPEAHEWEEVGIQDPTCSSAGWISYVCKHDASHTKTVEIPVNPTAHTWGEWEVTSPATCTDAAVETRVCLHDPTHIETREGEAALGHVWGEWQLTRRSTFWQEGEETRYCTRDASHFETRALDKLLKGDIDKDGSITVADALAVLRIAAALIEETQDAIDVADIDRDGEITVADALQVLRKSVRLITDEAWLA